MVDDQIKVTHDNNGRFYRIKMDLAKEGSELWDLTPYFKGRVGDNRFGLQVVWTYQGRLLDTTGMKPYIEGNVGNYSFNDKKDLQLAPDAATVRYTGNPSDCQAGGKATYYFPEQMFPRDGIFKGYIGLLDDRDDSSQPHISGVTVWFRVLPGIAQMGHACDVYISDLDKALQNFKVKLDQHDQDYQTQLQQVIDDARNAYDSETKNAHDAVIAAKAEVDATRANNETLNQQIENQQHYIDANNIVTRPELAKVQESIDDRLSNMQLKIQTYDTLDDLKQAHPAGADGLFYVLDSGDQYQWDSGTNDWIDKGKLITTGLSKKDSNSLSLAANHLDIYNNVPNATFDNDTVGWDYVGDPTSFELDTKNTVDNNPSLHLNVSGKDTATWYYILSDPFKVTAGNNINITFLSKNKNIDKPAIYSLVFYSDQQGQKQIGNSIDYSVTGSQGSFTPLSLKGQVPAGAVSARFKLTIQQNGEIWFTMPQNVTNANSAFSHEQLSDYASSSRQALAGSLNAPKPNFYLNWVVISPEITHFSKDLDGNYTVVEENHGETENKWKYVTTQEINLNNVKTISVIPLAEFSPDDESDTCNIYINFSNEGGQIIKTAANTYNYLSGNEEINNIVVPDKAVTFNIEYMLNKNGKLTFQYPKIYADTQSGFNSLLDAKKYDPYAHQNLLGTKKLDDKNAIWIGMGDGVTLDTTTLYENNPTIKITHSGLTNDAWNYAQFNIDVKNVNTISIDVPVKVKDMSTTLDGTDYAYIQSFFKDNNGKTIATYNSRGFYDNHDFFVFRIRNCKKPDNATTLELHLSSRRNGTVWFGKPEVWDSFTSLIASRKQLQETVESARKNLPQVFLTGDYDSVTGGKYTPMDFAFKCNDKVTNGYASVKWQGNSSQSYAKKNLKIKLFQDANLENKLEIKPKSEFPKENTFVLKANWIDYTQSRNLVNADLWREMTLNRKTIVKNPLNFAIGTQQPHILVGVGNTVQSENMYLIDNSAFNRQITISFDLTSDVAQGRFEVHLTKPDNLSISGGTLTGGTVHITKTITLAADPNEALPNFIYLITSNVPANAKVTIKNMSVVAGDKEISNADHPIDSINQLVKSPAAGAVQGFPVELFINGTDYGLYTFNTSHEDYLWNMDNKSTTNYALSSGIEATYDTDSTVISDDGAWQLEVPKKLDAVINGKFNDLLKFINSSTDDDFKANAFDHFDVMAAIDTYLVNSYFAMYDAAAKSIYMLTYDDGNFWIPCMYDFDSTWGLYWDGSRIEPQNAYLWESGPGMNNKVMINHLQRRVRDCFPDLVKQRWNYLKNNVFAPNHIVNKFKKFINNIGEENYENNLAIWSEIPSAKENNLQQIQRFVQQRFNYLDMLINAVSPDSEAHQPTTPVQPTTPTQTGGTTTGSQPTNNKPTDTTTTGSQPTTGQPATPTQTGAQATTGNPSTTDSKSTGTTTTDSK